MELSIQLSLIVMNAMIIYLASNELFSPFISFGHYSPHNALSKTREFLPREFATYLPGTSSPILPPM